MRGKQLSGTLDQVRGDEDGTSTRSNDRWLWPALCLIAALAAALRIAAAQGGLWLDEAWSAVFARDVGSAAGVFLHINHDNNHHLNTLWLQLVGFDAAPVLQRGMSIASGTAAVLVAGAIGARRSLATALVIAWLFALSPILVTYGSEARGYAPMVLALLGAFWLIDRWLDDRRRPPLSVALAVVFLLGLLAQLTMVFGTAALAGWVLLRLWREAGFGPAARESLRLLGLPLAVAVVTVAAVLWLLPGAGDFQVGAFTPFRLRDLVAGYDDMVGYTSGALHVPGWLLVAALIIPELVREPSLRSRRWFYLLAIVAVPVGMAVVQLGNTGMPRYHLLSAVALLLVAGELVGLALVRSHVSRNLALVLLGLFTLPALDAAWRLIDNQRSDPGRAVAFVQQAASGGATIAVERDRATAVIEAAAAAHRYPFRFDPCGTWLFVDRDGRDPFPPAPVRCGRRYHPVAYGYPTGLSGTYWKLYRRD